MRPKQKEDIQQSVHGNTTANAHLDAGEEPELVAVLPRHIYVVIVPPSLLAAAPFTATCSTAVTCIPGGQSELLLPALQLYARKLTQVAGPHLRDQRGRH